MIPLFTSSIAEFPVPVEGEGLFFRYFKKIFSKYSLLMVPCFFPALIKSLIDCIIPPYPDGSVEVICRIICVVIVLGLSLLR